MASLMFSIFCFVLFVFRRCCCADCSKHSLPWTMRKVCSKWELIYFNSFNTFDLSLFLLHLCRFVPCNSELQRVNLQFVQSIKQSFYKRVPHSEKERKTIKVHLNIHPIHFSGEKVINSTVKEFWMGKNSNFRIFFDVTGVEVESITSSKGLVFKQLQNETQSQKFLRFSRQLLCCSFEGHGEVNSLNLTMMPEWLGLAELNSYILYFVQSFFFYHRTS